jgi:hypothetical protein
MIFTATSHGGDPAQGQVPRLHRTGALSIAGSESNLDVTCHWLVPKLLGNLKRRALALATKSNDGPALPNFSFGRVGYERFADGLLRSSDFTSSTGPPASFHALKPPSM